MTIDGCRIRTSSLSYGNCIRTYVNSDVRIANCFLYRAAGEAVRRGQPLMSVYSPDILATQNELILAGRSGPQFRATLIGLACR